uniref:Uncharacterized protein n=1 Tax=Glossina brevipalpis TaxID=37001 RepID=A0A1A9WYU1_9MUSC
MNKKKEVLNTTITANSLPPRSLPNNEPAPQYKNSNSPHYHFNGKVIILSLLALTTIVCMHVCMAWWMSLTMHQCSLQEFVDIAVLKKDANINEFTPHPTHSQCVFIDTIPLSTGYTN